MTDRPTKGPCDPMCSIRIELPGWILADLRARADRKSIDAVELLHRAASLQRMLFERDNEAVVRDRLTGDEAVLRLTEIADAG